MPMRGSVAALALSIAFSGSSAGAQSHTVVYAYDALGRIVGASYSDGASVAYSYDAAGNRTQVSSTQATPRPIVGAVSAVVQYNTSQIIPLAPSGVYTSLSIATPPSHGAVTIGASSGTYTPSNGYVGADSFTYTATGPGGTSSPATVSVTVSLPAAPGANDASLSVGYNGAGSLALPVSGLASTAVLVATPSKGTATISGTTATYTAGTSQYGADSFTYQASGPGGASPVRTVSVQIANPPPPSASSLSVAVGNNTPANVVIPGGGDWVALTIVSSPAHGTLGAPSWSGTGWIVVYTPTGGYIGADAFTYSISNPGGASGNRTVTLNVAPPAPPSAGSTNLTLLSLTTGQVSLPVSGVASGANVVTGPSHGTVSLSGLTATYTPTGAYVGSDAFAYKAVGPGGTSAPATVSVTVQNRSPVAQNDVISTTQNQSVTFDPRVNDTDPEGQALAVGLAWGANQGSVQPNGTSVTYTPSAGYVGSDSFNYSITDGFGGTSTASVSVTVQPAPTFSAGVNTPSWFAQRYGNGPIEKDPPVSVSTANGAGPYTYSWERMSGDASTTVSPSGATATWSRTLNTMGQFTSQWRCKVTDSQGRVSYTPPVSVTFSRETSSLVADGPPVEEPTS